MKLPAFLLKGRPWFIGALLAFLSADAVWQKVEPAQNETARHLESLEIRIRDQAGLLASRERSLRESQAAWETLGRRVDLIEEKNDPGKALMWQERVEFLEATDETLRATSRRLDGKASRALAMIETIEQARFAETYQQLLEETEDLEMKLLAAMDGLRGENRAGLAELSESLRAFSEKQEALKAAFGKVQNVSASLRDQQLRSDAETRERLAGLEARITEVASREDRSFQGIWKRHSSGMFSVFAASNRKVLLGAAVAVREDGVLLSSAALALDAMHRLFLDPELRLIARRESDRREFPVIRCVLHPDFRDNGARAALSLLRIDTFGKALAALPWSADLPEPGSSLGVALPNSGDILDFQAASVQRSDPGAGVFRFACQSQAPRSGGPLFGVDGFVVGVDSGPLGGVSRGGVGLSIVKPLLDEF